MFKHTLKILQQMIGLISWWPEWLFQGFQYSHFYPWLLSRTDQVLPPTTVLFVVAVVVVVVVVMLCWWLCNDRSFLVICSKYQLIIFYHNLPWAGFIPELILFPSNVRVQWQSLNLLCFYHIRENNGNFVMETSGLLLKTK